MKYFLHLLKLFFIQLNFVLLVKLGFPKLSSANSLIRTHIYTLPLSLNLVTFLSLAHSLVHTLFPSLCISLLSLTHTRTHFFLSHSASLQLSFTHSYIHSPSPPLYIQQSFAHHFHSLYHCSSHSHSVTQGSKHTIIHSYSIYFCHLNPHSRPTVLFSQSLLSYFLPI